VDSTSAVHVFSLLTKISTVYIYIYWVPGLKITAEGTPFD